jgi:outer membrane PBP1 activator LpoA protein
MRRALAVLAAAALLAGCGSSDGTKEANQYVDAVNAAQGRLTTALDRLSGEISTSTDPAADRRTLQAFDAAVGRAVATLRRIEPPGDVAPLHRKLVRELETYDRELRRETAVLRSNDVKALLAAQRRLLAATNETSQQVNDTLDAINARLRS